MKSAIEFKTKVHVRVTGPAADMGKALDALYAQGWHVTNSGPKITDFPAVDQSQFEIRAEREANSDQQQLALAMQLRDVLP